MTEALPSRPVPLPGDFGPTADASAKRRFRVVRDAGEEEGGHHLCVMDLSFAKEDWEQPEASEFVVGKIVERLMTEAAKCAGGSTAAWGGTVHLGRPAVVASEPAPNGLRSVRCTVALRVEETPPSAANAVADMRAADDRRVAASLRDTFFVRAIEQQLIGDGTELVPEYVVVLDSSPSAERHWIKMTRMAREIASRATTAHLTFVAGATAAKSVDEVMKGPKFAGGFDLLAAVPGEGRVVLALACSVPTRADEVLESDDVEIWRVAAGDPALAAFVRKKK